MVSKYQKKGAVEMSLNLIIMLIIGLVVIGLVISFVTGLIGQASSQFEGQLSETETADKQAAIGKSGVFAVSPETLKMGPGDSRRIFFKVQNVQDAPLELGTTAQITTSVTAIGAANSCFEATNIFVQDVTVPAASVEAVPAVIQIPGSCADGSQFSLKFEYKPDGTTIQKTMFVDLQIVN